MSKSKNLYMANFNCTFGDENQPMLDYFEEIVLPAFTEKNERVTKNKTKYCFQNVKIIELHKNKFALSGIIVKQTTLEVKSRVDEKTGQLIKKNDKIKSDPFSYFIILLENHRMVLVKNQSGSPDLKAFEGLAKYALKEAAYINNFNPIKITLNVGSLPSKTKIEDQMSQIDHIYSVVLKFYPLNGDIENVCSGIRKQLKEFGSREGFTTIKEPENRNNIKKILSSNKGMFRSKVNGKNKNGEKITIDEDTVSAVIPVNINEDDTIDNNINSIFEQIKDNDNLELISEENKNKYKEWLPKIKNLFSKNNKLI